MAAKRTILTLIAGLALCACAGPGLDVIQVGPWFPAHDWRQVEIFTSRDQTRRPWGGIGIIHGQRVSAVSGRPKIRKMVAQARKLAAKMGADGLIIAVDTADNGPEMGVSREPEMFLSALAIKYVTVTSTAAAK
jgi:hypothetical protein